MMCRHRSRYAKQLELLKLGFMKLLSSKSKAVDEKKQKDLENRVIEKVKRGSKS